MTAPPHHRWTREDYDRDAREYLASLPLEHFMESTYQSTQREVFVESFALLRSRRSDVRYYNELLVQLKREGAIIRVVPDNMVVIGPLDDEPRSSYAIELEPYPVFWTLEYVSESNRRKDYVDNFEKYETVFKIPYYLIFDPEHQDLQLYRLQGGRYVPVAANAAGRYPIAELDLEVALHEGWVRFWHLGELLALPVELHGQMRAMAEQLRATQEELRRTQEKVRQREEELQRSQEELHQRDAALQQTQEKLRQLDTEIQRSQEELRQLDETLQRSQEEIRQRNAEIERHNDEMRRQQEREQAMVALLRPLVEARARQLGREDVLTQLPQGDGQRLTQWLAELG